MIHKNTFAGSRARTFLWNMIGSMLNAALTMAMTIITARLAGIENSGVIGLAFGLCQVFATLANFEVRPYQSTDLSERFSFSEYLGMRFLSCTTMTVICALYILGWKYEGEKASILFAVCMFKMLDAFSDVFQGLFQQKEHLEYAGKALSLRIVLVGTAYTATLFFTRNMIFAAWMMPAASLLCILLYDCMKARRFANPVAPVFHPAACKQILGACFPLFASAFMNMYILNATRIQIDALIPQLQGCWTPLYMPAALINLFSIFAFRPMLTTLRARWSCNRKKDFFKLITLLVVWVLLISVAVIGCGALWGVQFLEGLYGIPLQPYRPVLIVVLIGGAFNALATVLYYGITIMRCQYFLLLGDGIAFIATFIITPLFVKQYGLHGAAMAYLCSMLIRSLGFLLIILHRLRRRGADTT